MISGEALEKIATQYQAGVFPNIVREYVQNVFLSELYRLPEAGKLLFKGGTALRILYGSPRFSEDLDFSVMTVGKGEVKRFVEDLFVKVLAEIERTGIGIELGQKSGATTGGYFGTATFRMPDDPPVAIGINVSSRFGQKTTGEADSVAGDFVPTYTVIHLPQEQLVEEKIFGALRGRKKPRDFYDLYFMMRKGLLAPDQKKRLAKVKDAILADADSVEFRGELGAFLPASQQAIIRDFRRALEAELNRQVVG